MKTFTSSRPQVYCGCFPAVVLDLKLNVLTFIERAQAGSLDSRICVAWRSSGAVLFIADVLHPIDDFAVERLRNG